MQKQPRLHKALPLVYTGRKNLCKSPAVLMEGVRASCTNTLTLPLRDKPSRTRILVQGGQCRQAPSLFAQESSTAKPELPCAKARVPIQTLFGGKAFLFAVFPQTQPVCTHITSAVGPTVTPRPCATPPPHSFHTGSLYWCSPAHLRVVAGPLGPDRARGLSWLESACPTWFPKGSLGRGLAQPRLQLC